MKLVLFVCTGNYYRSRFAEYYFNFRARELGLRAKADSRGIESYRFRNHGPVSDEVKQYLRYIKVPPIELPRHPFQLALKDFGSFDLAIVMDQKEHAPLLKKYFPGIQTQVEFWNYPDNYVKSPSVILPQIKDRIDQMILQFD